MSNYTPRVQQALQMHQQGDYNSAKLLYVKALEENPSDAQALQLLGLILYTEKEYPSAIQLIQNAIKIDPTIYEAHNNLGLIYKETQEYAFALECFKRAIALAPNKALAHNNIATVYKQTNDYEEAIKHCESAIECEPQRDEFYFNLANVYYETDDYVSLEDTYKRVLKLKAFRPEVYVKLARVSEVLDKIDKAVEYMLRYLEYYPENYEIQAKVAIYNWINGEINACQKRIKMIHQREFDLHKVEDRFVAAYKYFLQALLDYKTSDNTIYADDMSLPVLYIIGDSHCLSYANLKIEYRGKLYRTEAKIIIGCKAWHLSQKENNYYKEQFRHIIAHLEDNAIALMIFGEIDCRLDDGILKHYAKEPSDLTQTIPSFVREYVGFIEEHCAIKGVNTLFSTVPAPMLVEGMQPDQVAQLKKVIGIFNASLEKETSKDRLYNTYAITANDQGESNQAYNIDRWHLLPSTIRLL